MGTAVKPRARLGNQVRLALLMAATAPDVVKLLGKVKKPSEELKGVIASLAAMMKSKEGETLAGLRGIYTALKTVPDAADEQVATAIALLGKLFGEGVGAPAPGVTPLEGIGNQGLGNLPAFSLGKLQAASPTAPGVYVARLIRAGKAKDGKNWTEEALKAAVTAGLFEGVPLSVYSYSGNYGKVDYHIPLSDSDFAGWVAGNQVGFVRNASWDDAQKAVYAMVHVTDPARQALVDSMLSQGLEGPGLSVYCSGAMDEEQNVHAIDVVHSMDMVTFPAAEGAIGVTLGAAVASVLGAAGAPVEPASPLPPETGVEPTASTPVGQKSWKDERDPQSDFFVTLGDYVRRQREAGAEVDPSGVVATYERWLGMWEAATEATFEDFATAFWASSENVASLVTREEEKPEAPKPVAPSAAPAGAQSVPAAPTESRPAGAGMPAVVGGVRGMSKELEARLEQLEGRVQVVDSESMVEQKLLASGLPGSVQDVMRSHLAGRVVSPDAVDGFIAAQQQTLAVLEAGLVSQAAIRLNGEPLPGGGQEQSAEAIVDAMLGVDKL